MKKYDYMDSLKSSINDYLENEVDDYMERLEDDRDDFEMDLFDDLWTVDSVTGNGSGSYTFNSQKAKENVVGNMDLVIEMASMFDINNEELGKRFMNEDWEWFDVSIRCYLLGQAISEVLDELENNID